MTANTRIATLGDIDALVKLRFDYFAEEKWEVPDNQREIIEKNLRQYFSKHMNNDFFAALVEVDSQIASAAFLAITNRPANLFCPTGKTGTFYNVLTYSKYRKKGYAADAMNFLLDKAKRLDLSYVELSASESGKPLYRRLGFKEPEPSGRFTEMKLSLL